MAAWASAGHLEKGPPMGDPCRFENAVRFRLDRTARSPQRPLPPPASPHLQWLPPPERSWPADARSLDGVSRIGQLWTSAPYDVTKGTNIFRVVCGLTRTRRWAGIRQQQVNNHGCWEPLRGPSIQRLVYSSSLIFFSLTPSAC